MFTDTLVKICGAFVVWDGITRPDKTSDGKPKYSLKVVVDPSNPDLALFNQLSQTALQQSKFAGVLPAGGRMPIGQAQATEFNGLYTGWAVLNCNTMRIPNVHDEATGALMDPMQYAAMIYGGQKVDVLVDCYEYDKSGNKGIATGLEAFSIIASANAPRQQFGGSGIDTSGAFGGGAAQGQQPAQGGYQQPAPAQQQPIRQPAPAQQPAPLAPAPLQMTAAANGVTLEQYLATPGWTEQMLIDQGLALRPQPMAPAPMAPAPMAQQPAGQPQQAHNFLPQQ
jgi:hypothetical protein